MINVDECHGYHQSLITWNAYEKKKKEEKIVNTDLRNYLYDKP